MATATSTQLRSLDAGVTTKPLPTLHLEAFAVPNARQVHGEVFPLVLRPSTDSEPQTIESATQQIQELADKGLLKDLLRKRMLSPCVIWRQCWSKIY